MTAPPETRLALANLDAIARGRVLIVGFGPDLARALPDAVVFHHDLRGHRATPGSIFAPWLEPSEPFDAVVVQMPKAIERLRMLLAMARGTMRRGAALVLVGRNDAGIRRAGAQLSEAIGASETLDYRFHARALIATLDREPVPSALDAWRTTFRAGDLTVVSYPGVFAHGRLDEGTERLLSALEVDAGARALDVGSGTGVLSAWLGRLGADVTAIDVDACALQATRETAPDAHVVASDVFGDVGEGYDVIVSNPPFHAATRQTTEPATRLVLEAPERLGRRGELWVVANRFLPYAGLFERAFGSFDVPFEDNRYRVYRARRA